MRSALLSLMALVFLPAVAWSQGADSPAPSVFEKAVAAAKSKMMADPAAAYALAVEAGEVAESNAAAGTGQPDEVAITLWLQGEALNRLNRANEAVPLLDRGLEIAKAQASDKKVYGDLMIARAGAARTAGDYALALTHYQGAQKVFANLDEDRSQALALQQVGSIYTDARDYAKALDFYKRAGETFAGDPSVNLARLNNMSHAQRELGNYIESEAGFREALAIAVDMESASLQARILANLASVQLAAGRLDEADATAASGLALSANGAPLGWENFLWGVRAQVALAKGQLGRAAELISRTFEGQDIAATPMPFREFHETAQEIYAALGQDDLALQHFKAFKRLDDDALSVSAAANTALMAAQFDFAGQELNLAKLRTETLEKQVALGKAQARQRTTIFVGLLVFSLLALAAGALHYNSMRRSRNTIRKANDSLNETNTALAKALKAKSEFLATTSHEIRTPLNGILGMTQLLMTRKDLAEDVRERVELVHASSETMKAIVDDILDLAKLETGTVTVEVGEFDLEHTIRSVSGFWRDTAQAKGLTLTASVEAVAGPVEGDERRVRQIVFNLLSNAVKFTDEGEIALCARMERTDECTHLVIEVTDSGCGIPADQLTDIFEPFHQVDGGTTRKHGGTGLGLSICRKLAVAMGGDVSVTSQPGQGSVFTLRIPIVELPASAVRGRAGAPKGSVLLIDGNLMRQSVLQAMLDGDGQDIGVADDLVSGLAWIQENGPNTIFVFEDELGADLGSVMDALLTLRDCAPHAQIVVNLGEASTLEEPMLRLAGVDEILAGPFEPLAAAALLAQLQVDDRSSKSTQEPKAA